MHCAVCANTIEKMLSKRDDLERVSVNFASETVSFESQKSSLDDHFFREVEKLGYHLIPLHEGGENELVSRRPLYIASTFCVLLVCVAMGPMMSDNVMDNITHYAFFYGLLQCILLLPILYVGRSFFINGMKHLVQKHPNMDTLVAIGAGAATIYSFFSLILLAYGNHFALHELYFESSGVIITLIFLGKQLEKQAKGKTGLAISKLLGLKSSKVVKIFKGEHILCDISEISVGDRVLIKVGEKIPVDGKVVFGESEVDEAMLTGESFPVNKSLTSEVFEGTLNLTGIIEVEVMKSPEHTLLSEIIQFVQSAQGSKAPIAKIADRVSEYFVPAVILIAIVTGVYWGVQSHSMSFSLMMTIAILVVACPCALGLATPTAIIVAMGVGARSGVLIRSGEVLETLHKVKRVVFDKTGTLTTGQIEVSKISSHIEMKHFLSLVGSLEKHSEHALGKAIVNYCSEMETRFFTYQSVKVHQGLGIEGHFNGVRVVIGNAKLMERENISIAFDEKQVASLSFVALNSTLIGVIYLSDRVRMEAKEVISTLREMGIETTLLTGDNSVVAEDVARQVGIEDVYFGMLPGEKGAVIEKYKQTGSVVFVGDGINDAPALAQSDVGIAIGTGTDIAIESAGVVLMRSTLYGVVHAIILSKKCLRNIKQNLFWAFIYNILLIPIAAGVFYTSYHLKLNPMISAFAMAFSSLCVVSNALRLNRLKLKENERSFKAVKDENSKSRMSVEMGEFYSQIDAEVSSVLATVEAYRKGTKSDVTVVEIRQMNCQKCVKKVTDVIMTFSHVSHVEVDLPLQRVSITHREKIDFIELSERLKEKNFTLIQ